MSLFEDWYITYNGGIENQEDILWALAKDGDGEYKEIVTFWMHKAFLAGKILSQGQTVLDANTAFEMIENPPEANEKLVELLRLE